MEGHQMSVPTIGTLPARAHATDAGADLKAAEYVVIPSQTRALVHTGTSVQLPAGTVGYITPRSGLATKHGVTVLNAPGTIDAGYTGELAVVLHNTGRQPFEVRPGDRIAQLVVHPVLLPEFTPVGGFADTDRGDGGFGSTGV